MLKCKGKKIHKQCKSPSTLDTEKKSTHESAHELFSKAFDKASKDIHKQRIFIKSCKEKYSLYKKADQLVKQEIKYFRMQDFAKRRLFTEHRYIGVRNSYDAFQSTEQIRKMTTPEILIAFWQTIQAKDLLHSKNLQEDKEELPECTENPSETALHKTIDNVPTDHGDFDERKEGEITVHIPLSQESLVAEAGDVKAVTYHGSMNSGNKDKSTNRKTTKSRVAPPQSTLNTDKVPQAFSIMEGEIQEREECPSETSLNKTIEDVPPDQGDFDERKEGELTIYSPLTPDILVADAQKIKAVTYPGSMDSENKDESTIRKTTKSRVAPPQSTLKTDEVAQAVSIMEGEVRERAEGPSETSLHKTIEDVPPYQGDFDERKEGELTIYSPLTRDIVVAHAQNIKAVTSPGSLDSGNKDESTNRKITESAVDPPQSTLKIDEVPQAVAILEGEVPECAEGPSEVSLHKTNDDVPTDHGEFDERKKCEQTVYSSLTTNILGAEAQDIKAVAYPGSMDSHNKDESANRKSTKSPVAPPRSTLNLDKVPQGVAIMEGEVPEHAEGPSETALHETIDDVPTDHRDFDERKECELTIHSPLTTDILGEETQDVKAVTYPGSIDSHNKDESTNRKTTKSPVASHQSTLNIDEFLQDIAVLESGNECQPDAQHPFTQTLESETSHQSKQTLEAITWYQSTQTDVHHHCVRALIEVVISRSARQSKLCPSEFLKEHLLGKVLAEIKGNDLNITPKRVKHLDKVIVKDICKLLSCKEKDLLDIMNLMDPALDKVIVPTFSRHLLALSDMSHLNSSVQDEKYRLSVETCVEQFVTYVRKHSDRICTVKEADAISQRIFIQLWTELKEKHDKIPLENFNELSKVIYKDLCKKWGSPRSILFFMQLNIPEHDKEVVDTFRQHLMNSKKERIRSNLGSKISQWLGALQKK